jgi:hypothetical protein
VPSLGLGKSTLIGCGLELLTPFCKTHRDKHNTLLNLKTLWQQECEGCKKQVREVDGLWPHYLWQVYCYFLRAGIADDILQNVFR